MIAQLYTGISAEFKKIKNTFTYWFTLISAVLIPFLVTMIQAFRHKYYIPKEGVNPWEKLFEMNLSSVAFFLFPVYIVLSVALNLGIEHKENSWKKLLLLPVKRSNIYFSKVLFLLIQVVFALVLFHTTILLSGYSLGLIHSELKYTEFNPLLVEHSVKLLHLFVAILAIFSIQYVISLFAKNTIIPITIGVFGVIISLIINGWKYAIYFPYSFGMVSLSAGKGNQLETWHGFTIVDALSITLFVVVLFAGNYIFRKKQLR